MYIPLQCAYEANLIFRDRGRERGGDRSGEREREPRERNERTNERFVELGRLPMSNREVGVGGEDIFCA